MLHEVLLALAGHPSPLFEDNIEQLEPKDQAIPFLSPSERALLATLGRLSTLHRKLRDHIASVATDHPSTICRAVATSIQERHLARFQDHILDVESKILIKDARLVGAYNIVPLAGIVEEFDQWHRRMEFYCNVASFMRPLSEKSNSQQCTGAAIIDRLRSEQKTGFPDIEAAAVELSTTAESAFLRQLASWVLHGRMPTVGADDFFIKLTERDEGVHVSKDMKLLPGFVTAQTASSVLFVGRSLQQIRSYGRQQISRTTKTPKTESELAASHLQYFSALSLPISSSDLTRAVTAIRLSLSQNVLRYLLPMELTLTLFACIERYFLLSSGEFVVLLIKEADTKLQARQQGMDRLLQQDPVKSMKGLSLKDHELQQTLSQTWRQLAALDDDAADDTLRFAEKHFNMSASGPASRPSTSDSMIEEAPELSTIVFNDLLFPNAVDLGMNITPPLDLIISQRDISTYSTINAYLLSLRRAELRLADLWRRTGARRDSPFKGTAAEVTPLDRRQRVAQRRVATRKVWATCSAAVFLLSELSAYLEGEVIRGSWQQFLEWMKQESYSGNLQASQISNEAKVVEPITQRDPETLASGHRAFLASLTYALLLNDAQYTQELRSLLGNVDSLIAFFNRQLDIQQKLDTEYDTGGDTEYTTSEYGRISLELDRARKKVDSDLRSVINRLRQMDRERMGSGRYLEVIAHGSGFEPWKGGGVDRLLMKLEFGRMSVDDYDLV